MRQFSRLPVSSILHASAAPSQFQRVQHQRRGTAGSLLLSFSSYTSHARAFGSGGSSSVEKSFLRSVIGGQRSSSSSTSSTSKTTAARAGEREDMATPTSTTTTTAAGGDEQPKCEWLVVLPDKPGVLEKRVQVRGQHIAAIASAYPSDFWLVAGALLERAPHEIAADEAKDAAAPPPLPMQGSAGLVWASSAEEIRRLLSGDVYAREGVWDMERLQCWAFKSAVRRTW
ncbi:uncharacterized protein J3D65DRAFT_637058 [Phyllosticta citribraziliensis]|uniref:YCII-related domain-containing protein n=1 Tax=Phyllosticta citribraziliensis TaxID=989973 RepID=A0ABR1LB85_9PEZI